MQVNDTITLDGVRRTSDGYLVASAKVARTGIQIYGGAEVGRPDLRQVRVFRPEAEVFSKDTLASFAHRPVTLDHPSSMVSAANWRALAKGWTDGEIARDGECVRISMLIADQATIDAIEGGKRELSMGYTTDLKWEAGVTPSGEAYDAIQTSIRANHLAVVAAARGGSQLRIGDSTGETIMSDRLPPGATMLADGSAKYVFSDGSSVVMSPDTSVTYFDAGGYMSHGLTDQQYLFESERAGGSEGRQKAFDGMVNTEVAHRGMVDRMQAASRNELESRRRASDGSAEDARRAMIADMASAYTDPSSV